MNDAAFGMLGSAAGMGLNALVPGLGSVLMPLAEGIYGFMKQKSEARKNINKLYSTIRTMEYGGTLSGRSDLSHYKGKAHREGGIMVSPKGTPGKKASAEVEGGETRLTVGDNVYVFSNKLMIE